MVESSGGKMMDNDEILSEVEKIIEQSSSKEEKLGKICELLKKKVDHYDWVGFYLVDNGELVLGPYSGEPTEHTNIGFGEGICGQAADREETFVVQDVSQESNYLSCSPKVESEIVLPIFKKGEVVGELDIDSHQKSPFTSEDEKLLEKITKLVGKIL